MHNTPAKPNRRPRLALLAAAALGLLAAILIPVAVYAACNVNNILYSNISISIDDDPGYLVADCSTEFTITVTSDTYIEGGTYAEVLIEMEEGSGGGKISGLPKTISVPVPAGGAGSSIVTLTGEGPITETNKVTLTATLVGGEHYPPLPEGEEEPNDCVAKIEVHVHGVISIDGYSGDRILPGESVQLDAVTYPADEEVEWSWSIGEEDSLSCSDPDNPPSVTIDENGLLTVNETSGSGIVMVKATLEDCHSIELPVLVGCDSSSCGSGSCDASGTSSAEVCSILFKMSLGRTHIGDRVHAGYVFIRAPAPSETLGTIDAIRLFPIARDPNNRWQPVAEIVHQTSTNRVIQAPETIVEINKLEDFDNEYIVTFRSPTLGNQLMVYPNVGPVIAQYHFSYGYLPDQIIALSITHKYFQASILPSCPLIVSSLAIGLWFQVRDPSSAPDNHPVLRSI
jgi:hypothetical protein